jgi:hypothetical protein
MKNLLIRCSAIGKLMTEPVSIGDQFRTPEVEEIIAKKKRTDEQKALLDSLKARTLSEGAKTHIRNLVSQDIFGVDFEVTSKEMEKGTLCEPDAIALLNRVRGLDLSKNTERKENEWISGECDLFDASARSGHDLKCSWSVATFPIARVDCEDKLYEWQMRGYMWLWDANEWEVNYALLSTPEHLIRFEPASMHFVDHIPEHMRLTTWTVKRDIGKEFAMVEKIKAAREYYAQVLAEFTESHAIRAAA